MFFHCLRLTVITSVFSALGMSLPYVTGMIAGQGMDPRALNAGSLVYPYGSHMMSFPNFSAAYGQGQRMKNIEDATTLEKTANSSSQLRLVKRETCFFVLYSWSRTLSSHGHPQINAWERVTLPGFNIPSRRVIESKRKSMKCLFCACSKTLLQISLCSWDNFQCLSKPCRQNRIQL